MGDGLLHPLELIVQRLPAGVTIAIALAILLATLGLASPLGAVAATLSILWAHLVAGWPGVSLAAFTLVVAGLGSRWSAAQTNEVPRHPAKIGAAQVLGLTVVAWACAGISMLAPLAGYWIAAMCGALAAALAHHCSGAATRAFSGRRVRIPTLRPVAADIDRGIGTAGLFAAALSASALVWLAWRLRLLGPGDPGLVAVAAIAATTLVSSAPGARRPVPGLLVSSLLGAAGAAALVAFMP